MQTPIEQAPTSSHRIIIFQAGQRGDRSANATRDQDRTIREQARGMAGPRRFEVAAPRPETGGGIVDFRTGDALAVALSTRDEHPPISQQGLGLLKSGHVEAAGVGPGPRRRIVQLSGGNRTAGSVAACDEHFAVG